MEGKRESKGKRKGVGKERGLGFPSEATLWPVCLLRDLGWACALRRPSEFAPPPHRLEAIMLLGFLQ